MNKRPELDTINPPGQVRNELPVGYGQSGVIVNPIPKQECEKLTFDEWYKRMYEGSFYERYVPKKHLQNCWNAAQENK